MVTPEVEASLKQHDIKSVIVMGIEVRTSVLCAIKSADIRLLRYPVPHLRAYFSAGLSIPWLRRTHSCRRRLEFQ